MAELFTAKFLYLWIVVLTVLLFFPVRHLIWVMQVRRVERRIGGPTDDAERQRLKRRAGVPAALLSFVFSTFYLMHLFQGRP